MNGTVDWPKKFFPEIDRESWEVIDEERRRLEARVAKYPNDAVAHKDLAATRQSLDDTRGAIVAARVAVYLDPSLVDAHHVMAVAFLEEERLNEAERALRRVMEICPMHWRAAGTMGLVMNWRKQYGKALEWLDFALSINPRSPKLHMGRCRALANLGRLDEAVEAIKRCIEIEPHRPYAHRMLGRILRRQGRMAEAKAALDRAVETTPTDAIAHDERAAVLDYFGLYEEAERERQAAGEVDSGWWRDRSRLLARGP